MFAFVPRDDVEAVLAAMVAYPLGREPRIIGTEEHPGVVVGHTPLGGTRIIDRPLGEQLPRIC